jgi:PAS domain S-box-containing protein
MIVQKTSDGQPIDETTSDVRTHADATTTHSLYSRPSLQRDTESPEERRQLIHQLNTLKIEVRRLNDQLQQTQAELHASRARCVELYDLAPVGYLTLNDSGQILELNHSACDLLGTPCNLIPHSPFTKHILPADQDIFHQRQKQLLESGEQQNFELRLLKPDGTPFRAHLTTTSCDTLTGSRTYRVAINDISERVLLQQRAEDAEAKFRNLFENGPIGVAYHKMIYDAAGKPIDYYFIDANTSYQKLTGVDPRGKTVTQAFPEIEHDVTDWIGIFGKVARTGEPIRIERYLPLNDHWYDCVGYQYKQDHFVAAFLDITERKKAEEALIKSMTLLNITQRLSHVGGWEYDVASQSSTWTEETYRIHDLPQDQVVLHTPNIISSYYDFYDPADRPIISKAFQRCITEGVPYDLEFPFTSAAGRRLWIRTTAQAIRNDTGNIIRLVGTIQDITTQKHLDAELLKLQKLESLGTLAGGIAHDFNNILMGLFGNISIARNELVQDHPAYKPLDDASKCMGRAIRLTKQLLTLSKGGDPIKEELGLGSLVEEVARFDLTGSNIILVFKQAPDLWRTQADKGQIQQVISNLTINARDAMPNGGHLYITLENTEVKYNTIPGLEQGPYIKIAVRDLGIGIPPECIDRIFDPYFTTKQSSSGLGLATTHSIISKHSGHIEVASELGKGSLFTIYLPALISHAQVSSAPPASPRSAIRPSTRILILDDEEFIRMVIPRWLKPTGCLVETVDEGSQAIAAYKKAYDAGRPFDVAILDLTIPGGVGGVEVLKQIRTFDPHAKVIASSGYADGSIMSNYASYGFVGVIAKPYTADELHAVLAQTLDAPNA